MLSANQYIKKVKVQMIVRYSLGILLIGILATFSFNKTSKIVAYEKPRSTIINISGRQRMLSQRIAFLTLQHLSAQTEKQQEITRKQLQKAKKLFLHSHQTLSGGISEKYLSNDISQEIFNMYFAEPHDIDKKINGYLRDVEDLLAESDAEIKELRLGEILRKTSNELLLSLDAVVKQYEKENLKSMKEIRDIAIYILILTFFVLFAKLVLVLLPTAKIVERSYREIINAEKSERDNQAKDQFLANMSHELRTPLNSIIGLVKILKKEKDIKSEHKDVLDVINKSSESLLETVNDILDISKIEAGKVELENRSFNISGLIYSLVDQLKPLASRKGLTLETNVDELNACYVTGDEFRLMRILLNLGSNAIKYTDKGIVTVDTDLIPGKPDEVIFKCTIEDTGIGIPENKIDKIFEKFTQAEESTERRFGGTGLGLNITKQLIELMNGQIYVESKVGRGSKFTAEIPFKTSRKIDQKKQKYTNIEWKENIKDTVRIPIIESNILIAEDHEFNQIFITKLIERIGCLKFDIAKDGVETIEKWKTQEYDIILMDCHMPRQNGYEATKQIRQIEKEQNLKRTPIIAMTADAMVGTREACLEVGMDEYLSKPIDEDIFISILQNVFIIDKNDFLNGTANDDSSRDVVNLKILKDYAENDPKVEKQLIGIFYVKALEDINLMGKELKGGKNQNWSDVAHSLKGSSAYIGAKRLQLLCARAQNMVFATSQERESMFKELKIEFDNVCKFLRDIKMLE